MPRARAREVPHRFVFDGRHVDRRQIARAKQTSELDGISPIRLHSLARLLGNEGGGHDQTRDAFLRERPIQAVAARTGLAGDDEPGGVTVQPSKELFEVGFSRANLPDVDDVGRVVDGGVGDRDAVLMDVQTDEIGW
jgi:hypothetical protein